MATRKNVAPDEEGLVTVTPVHPFQVAYAGKVAAPGESLKVPDGVAARWELSGIVTRSGVVRK